MRGRHLHLGRVIDPHHPLNRGLRSELAGVPRLAGSAGKWWDVTHKHHATLGAGPTWTGAWGRPGGKRSVSFNGGSQYAALPAGLPSLTGDWTFACWARRWDPFRLNQDVLYSRWVNSTTQRQLYWYIRQNSTDAGKVQIDIPWVKAVLTGNTVIDLQWHHHAITKVGTTWTIYLDGEPDGSVVDATAQEANTSAPRWAASTGDGNFLYGLLDECMVLDRGMDGDEIHGVFEETLRGNPDRWAWVPTRSWFMPGQAAAAFQAAWARGSNVVVSPGAV